MGQNEHLFNARLMDLRRALLDLKHEDIKEAVWLVRTTFKQLQNEETSKAYLQFHIGQTVQFKSKKRSGATIKGKIESINTKSIFLIAENGERWRVSPTLVYPTTRILSIKYFNS
jgi:hypothetical protein